MKLNKLQGFFDNNDLVVSLKHGLTLAIPFLLAGSFSLIFTSFPLPAYQEFLQTGAGAFLRHFFNLIYQCTLNSISFVLILTISYSYSRSKHVETPCFYILTSGCAYLICTFDPMTAGERVFGANWSFTAILITLAACSLLHFCMKHATKTKFYTQGAGHYFNMSMLALFPILAVLLLFTLPVCILHFVAPGMSGQNLLTNGLIFLFEKIGGNFFGALLYVLLMHLFWFFGIHGANIVYPVAEKLFVDNNTVNLALLAQGQAPVNIFTYSFFDVFVMIGGSGTCICLVIALFIASRHQANRRLAKFAVFPAVFNISEPLILGMPIVFNPIMLIPFVGTPVVSLLLSGAAMRLGLVPYATRAVNWTTPPLLDGYFATGSLAGSALQLICVAVGVLIYIPFIRLSEKRQTELLCDNISRLTEYTMEAEEGGSFAVLLDENSPLLGPAKVLVSDLRYAVKNRELQMYYQPQVDSGGNLYGVEALLRWKHPVADYIYPPLIIGLANEDGFLDELGEQIIDMSCKDIEKMAKNGMAIKATINVLPRQLENPGFCERYREITGQYNLGNVTIGLEFTEQIALCNTPNVLGNLEELRQMNVPLIMDDFGVGHSSMMYLQNNHFDVVKLDGQLVRHLMDNERSESITKTITSLAEPLGFDVVAEYVETEKQRDKLEELGCRIYQGYYYSRAMSLDHFMEYIGASFGAGLPISPAKPEGETAEAPQ